jgi:hypothetical protein
LQYKIFYNITYFGTGEDNEKPGSIPGVNSPIIRLTRRTVTNFIFYCRFAVHNIFQYYFGTWEDDKKPGSIPGDTRMIQTKSIPGRVRSMVFIIPKVEDGKWFHIFLSLLCKATIFERLLEEVKTERKSNCNKALWRCRNVTLR